LVRYRRSQKRYVFSGTVWKSSDFRQFSWMYNNTKDVKTAIDNTLRVSAPLRPCVKLKNNNAKTPLRPCVKLKNNNAKTQRRDGAKNKNLWVYFTGIFDCAVFS